MNFRKLTLFEFLYMWYIEYGAPFHWITPPPNIGATIKKLIEDGFLIQLPNPSLDKSPLYTRFTKEGRVLFGLHEIALGFKHPTDEGVDYAAIMETFDVERLNTIIGHAITNVMTYTYP
jgi:hypothetical protein